MELQEIFTKVRDHLLAQKVRSNDPCLPFMPCLYRGPGGLKCAVGCLIPDDKEVPVLYNSLDISRVLNRDPYFLGFEVSNAALGLLKALQIIHDRVNPAKWEDYLKELAIERNLKW